MAEQDRPSDQRRRPCDQRHRLVVRARRNGSHLGSMFIILDPFEERRSPDLTADAIAQTLRARFYKEIQEANIAVFGAPPVRGLGNAGGFKIMIEDRGNEGLEMLQQQTDELIQTGNQQPGLVGLFTVFRANTPQLYVDIDRTKCKTMGVRHERRLRRPAGRSRRAVRQRFQPVRPHLAGERPGRHAASACSPRTCGACKCATTSGQMVPLGAVAVGRARRRAVRHQPLQHVSRRRRSTALALPGMSSGRGHRQNARNWPRSSFPRRWASNGPT